MWGFVVGQTYNRRRDIHQKFGGQRQGGISTPAKHRTVFIFTGPSGVKHGYSDEWSQDGTYRYYGEGQRGDMILQRGNRAIANHAVDGNDLLLFRTLGRGQVRFLGPFNCAGYRVEEGRDSTGVSRKVIVFDLAPPDRPALRCMLLFDASAPDQRAELGKMSADRIDH
jgi:5-methylcytosine-specific restriction enzyme A